MQLEFSDLGRPSTKSIDITFHAPAGTGIGWSSPGYFALSGFDLQQSPLILLSTRQPELVLVGAVLGTLLSPVLPVGKWHIHDTNPESFPSFQSKRIIS